MYKYTSYNENFWACDFETTTNQTKYFQDTGGSKVWLAYAKQFNPRGEYDENTDEILVVNIDDFFNQFWQRKESATLFFHNLSWDGEFIKWYLVQNGYQYYPKEPSKKSSKGWSIIEDDKKIYFINIWKSVRYNKNSSKIVNLYIRCSYVLFSLPIEKLGEIFKSGAKKSIDYHVEGWDKLEDVPQECIDYIKEDVHILIKPLIQFNKEFKITRFFECKYKSKTQNKAVRAKKKETWGLSKLTASSTALNLFKNTIHNKISFKKEFMLPYDLVLELFNWYSGGLTTYNEKYQYKMTYDLDGHVYDVNSMYPAVMVDNPYPIGYPEKTQIDERYNIRMIKIFVKKATIKNQDWPAILKRPRITLYDYKKDYGGQLPRYVKYAENATMYFFEDELESLKRFYDFEYVIEDEWWFKSEYYFKDFILEYYNKRQEYRKNKDPREQTVKILLNSAYGKFGQKPDRDSIIYSYDNLNLGQTIDADKEYIITTIRQESSCINELKCYKVKPKIPHEFNTNVAIAACVCKNARIKLHDAIYENIDDFIYCDTDSVFLKKPAKGIEIDNSKLGAWKLEYRFDSAEVGGAKLYCLYLKGVKTKDAYAGINKKWAKKNIKQHDIITIDNVLGRGSKLSVQKVKGGAIINETEFTIKKRV